LVFDFSTASTQIGNQKSIAGGNHRTQQHVRRAHVRLRAVADAAVELTPLGPSRSPCGAPRRTTAASPSPHAVEDGALSIGGVNARAHFANPRVSHAAVTDRDTDPLLLDSERRYLEKFRRVRAGHLEGCSAPPHRSAPRHPSRSALSGSPISTSGAPAWQGLAILDATFMRASTIMSRRRVY
jgi:hypothetical protein